MRACELVLGLRGGQRLFQRRELAAHRGDLLVDEVDGRLGAGRELLLALQRLLRFCELGAGVAALLRVEQALQLVTLALRLGQR